jgi:hypothetical protein
MAEHDACDTTDNAWRERQPINEICDQGSEEDEAEDAKEKTYDGKSPGRKGACGPRITSRRGRYLWHS